MTQQIVNTGTFGVVGSGDPAPVAFGKVNSNFTDLYSGVGQVTVAKGMDPTGGTDSSSALQIAVNSGATLIQVPPANPGKTYIVHDITIPSGVTLLCHGCNFVDAAGAQFVFFLQGISSKLIGARIASSLNCAQATIIVQNSQACVIEDVFIVNAVNGIKIQQSGGVTPGDKVFISNTFIFTFTGIGLWVRPNCANTRCTQVYIDGGLVSGGGGLIPPASTTGVLIDSTGSTFAFGGHVLEAVQVSNTQDAFYFNNTNLVILTGCVADDNSARGFAFDGTTNVVAMTGCFTGPAFVGVYAAGTAKAIWCTGLTTINNGNIPPGGGSTYYTSATSSYNGYTAPGSAQDIQTAGTASMAVDCGTWMATQGTAHNYLVGAGTVLAFTGSERLNFSSLTTVATGGTTVYLGPVGQSGTNGASEWIAPFNCVVQGFYAQFNVAPGAGSYVFTLYVNASAKALTGTSSGSGVFALEVLNGTQVAVSKNSTIQMQLVNNGAGGATFVNGYLVLLPQP